MQIEFLKFTIKNTKSSGKLHIGKNIYIYAAVSVYLHVLKKQVEGFYSCGFRVKNYSNWTESDY